jgi:heptosyltransferase I
LASFLRKSNYDIAFVFYAPWWVSRALWKAGIKSRVGVASKIWAWAFYNIPVRQKRSRAEKHESEYNLDLIKKGLQKTSHDSTLRRAQIEPISVPVSLEQKEQASNLLKNLGVHGKYTVIHPGMAGSALNWPPENYFELAKRILEKGETVVITGTKMDLEIIHKSRIELLPGIVSLVDKTPAGLIFAVLANAQAVVAPSTGVVHMAASVGVPTVGIYSPVKVQAPKRWGPLGVKVKVLVPSVLCPGRQACLGKSCQFHDCMRQISVEQVIGALEGAWRDS